MSDHDAHDPQKQKPQEKPRKKVSLPVVGAGAKKTFLEQAELGDEEAGTRSPAAWVLLGAMATFVVLVPEAMLATWALTAIYRRGAEASAGTNELPFLPFVLVSIASVVLASLAGGALIGRFGPKITVRMGALVGALVGVVLWALSRTVLGVVVLPVTLSMAALGVVLGRRGRTKR